MTTHTPFHTEEINVQKKTGFADRVAKYGNNFIRSYMPEQHCLFFEQLPFMIAGLIDQSGHPWAVPIIGKKGFIQSPDEHTLQLNTQPLWTQTLKLQTTIDSKIGLLGIEPETRRRNRMNGTISLSQSHKLEVKVDQSFGNCPKYIQKRHIEWTNITANTTNTQPPETSSYLSVDAKKLIKNADTFFIASRASELTKDPRAGIDVSHRGGRPGFIKIYDDNHLYFPDFSGNRFFNTLGNIQADSRVGLFFIDFTTGDVLLIAAQASIDWDKDRLSEFKGAERFINIKPISIIYTKAALHLTSELVEVSPVLHKTGVWQNPIKA